MNLLAKLAYRLAGPGIARLNAIVRESVQANRRQLEDLLLLQGRILARMNAEHFPGLCIQDAEFKVFSQFGEDGILQHLLKEAQIGRSEATFVEFGVQDYSEANTRFLLLKDRWRGLIIDGNKQHMDKVRSDEIYWRNDITAIDAWIDRDNINQLIGDAGFSGKIGVLSVDLDGIDYWVWEQIEVVDPVIVVVEWNSAFGPEHPVSVPYDPAFHRDQAHYSGAYWGASIAAFAQLAESKGLALVGSNSAGNNLFFVRKDRLGRLSPLSPRQAYVDASFRDSRDREGKLDFLDANRRKDVLADLELIRVTDNKRVTLRELSLQTARERVL